MERCLSVHVASFGFSGQDEMFEKGKAAGIETRGVADHGFVHSIYFRDPNGYVIELAAPTDSAGGYAAEAEKTAHDALTAWQETKPPAH